MITLGRATSKEAVCVVFEKVNTGGKALDAFELVTAMYAAEGHELRKDWYGDDTTKGATADSLRPSAAGLGQRHYRRRVEYGLPAGGLAVLYAGAATSGPSRRENRERSCRPSPATGRRS